MKTDALLALIYVTAMVAANYTVMLFGPWFSIINSFVFIGLDLSLRDMWHERRGLRGSIALVFVSGVISYTVNPAMGMIAVASFAAFTLSGLADAIVYQRLNSMSYIFRANGSNVTGALVDSIVFPVVAFGGFPIEIIVGQIVAKVAGGALWGALINRFRVKLLVSEVAK